MRFYLLDGDIVTCEEISVLEEVVEGNYTVEGSFR